MVIMLRFCAHVFFLAFLVKCFAPHAHADIFHLKNGTQFEANLESFNGKLFSYKLPDGTLKSIAKEEVSLFEVAKINPAPAVAPAFLIDDTKGPFENPRQTFFTWRKAAQSDDIDGMAKCYIASKQSQIKKELKKIPKTKRAEMRDAAIQTRFFPNDPFFQGDRATLEVTWQKDIQSDVQTLQFMLEGKDWKIIQ